MSTKSHACQEKASFCVHLVFVRRADPILEVSMIPDDHTGLDVPPGNSFNFNCFVDIPSYLPTANISVRIELEGMVLKEMSTVASGPTTSIESYTVHELSAGTYEYRCLAILYIPGENPRKYDAHLPVFIKG